MYDTCLKRISGDDNLILYSVELMSHNGCPTVGNFCDFISKKEIIVESLEAINIIIANDNDYTVSIDGSISIKNPETFKATTRMDGKHIYGVCNIYGSVRTGIFSKDKIEDHYNDHIRQVFLVKRKANPVSNYFVYDYIIILSDDTIHGIIELLPTSESSTWGVKLHTDDELTVKDFYNFLTTNVFYKDKYGVIKVAYDSTDFNFDYLCRHLAYGHKNFTKSDLINLANHGNQHIIDIRCQHVPSFNDQYNFVLLVSDQLWCANFFHVDNETHSIKYDMEANEIRIAKSIILSSPIIVGTFATVVTDCVSRILNDSDAFRCLGNIYFCEEDNISIPFLTNTAWLEKNALSSPYSRAGEPALVRLHHDKTIKTAYMIKIYDVIEKSYRYDFVICLGKDSKHIIHAFLNQKIFKSKSWYEHDHTYSLYTTVEPYTTVRDFIKFINASNCYLYEKPVGITTQPYKCDLDSLEEFGDENSIKCSWNGYIMQKCQDYIVTRVAMSMFVNAKRQITIEKCIIEIDDFGDVSIPFSMPTDGCDTDTMTASKIIESDLKELAKHIALYFPENENKLQAKDHLDRMAKQLSSALNKNQHESN